MLRLSSDVARNPSVAALGIVAHEIGHAVQDNIGYAPMRIRSALVPAANLGSRFGFICVILGLILYMFGAGFGLNVMWAGIGLFAAAVLFALVTLPVEYNASNRARQMLQTTGAGFDSRVCGGQCCSVSSSPDLCSCFASGSGSAFLLRSVGGRYGAKVAALPLLG